MVDETVTVSNGSQRSKFRQNIFIVMLFVIVRDLPAERASFVNQFYLKRPGIQIDGI